MIGRVRKLALDTPSTAIVIVIRTGKTIPFVVPITRVRNRLELGLRFVDRRATLLRVDPSEVALVAFNHESDYLVERRPCFSRVWLLLEDGRKVYMSGNRQSQLIRSKSKGVDTGQCTDTSRSELEAPFARLSTPKTCLHELWIKVESTVSALLCKIVSVGISHVTRMHMHSTRETHSLSFNHAAAIFERYKAEGPLIWIATSNSAIASRYSLLRKCAFP